MPQAQVEQVRVASGKEIPDPQDPLPIAQGGGRRRGLTASELRAGPHDALTLNDTTVIRKGPARSDVERRRVTRLVQADLVAAGKPYRRHQAPALVLRRGAFEALLAEIADGPFDVVAHQVQLLVTGALGRDGRRARPDPGRRVLG
jgi:hypothetical protein